jgi:hypothetical protein
MDSENYENGYNGYIDILNLDEFKKKKNQVFFWRSEG